MIKKHGNRFAPEKKTGNHTVVIFTYAFVLLCGGIYSRQICISRIIRQENRHNTSDT